MLQKSKQIILILTALLIPLFHVMANQVPDDIMEKLYMIRIRNSLGTDQHRELMRNLEKLLHMNQGDRVLSQIYDQYLEITPHLKEGRFNFNTRLSLSRINSELYAHLSNRTEIRDPNLIQLNQIEEYLEKRKKLTTERSDYLEKLEAIRNNLLRKVVAQQGVQGAQGFAKSRGGTVSSSRDQKNDISALINSDREGIKYRALRKSCYVVVEKAGNFEKKTVETISASLISRYLRRVRVIPMSGIKADECIFRVVLTETDEGFSYTIASDNINSLGASQKPGTDGLAQSILRAIYLSRDDAELKGRICSDHTALMQEDCRTVGAVIVFYDEQGQEIVDNSTVREGDSFYLLVRPDTTLHASIISKDSSGNYFRIFPNPDVTDVTNPLVEDRNYFFPPYGSDLIFKFDENTGDEMFYFVMSPTPTSDIDRILNILERGTAKDRAAAVRLFEQRVASRGFSLDKKKVKLRNFGNIGNGPTKGDLLDKSGGFVKVVRLKHVR